MKAGQLPPLSILINVGYPLLSFRALAVIVPAVILLAAHGSDSRPLTNRSLTSAWEADQLYFDTRLLAGDLPPGDYQVGVQVYSFTDQTFSQVDLLAAQPCTDDPTCHYVIVDEIQIMP